MKKMSKFSRAALVFMAGTPGRLVRGATGVALVILGIIGGGWSLLLLIPGALMITTGIMNYCPAGLFVTGSGKSDDILAEIAKFDALGSSVHKH
jgi:hypothetical protein